MFEIRAPNSAVDRQCYKCQSGTYRKGNMTQCQSHTRCTAGQIEDAGAPPTRSTDRTCVPVPPKVTDTTAVMEIEFPTVALSEMTTAERDEFEDEIKDMVVDNSGEMIPVSKIRSVQLYPRVSRRRALEGTVARLVINVEGTPCVDREKALKAVNAAIANSRMVIANLVVSGEKVAAAVTNPVKMNSPVCTTTVTTSTATTTVMAAATSNGLFDRSPLMLATAGVVVLLIILLFVYTLARCGRRDDAPINKLGVTSSMPPPREFQMSTRSVTNPAYTHQTMTLQPQQS